ncbi:MAG: GEVED domain-containing protein [Flavobacteriales bacterium]
MKRLVSMAALIFFTALAVPAQTLNCGADQVHQDQLLQNPAYARRVAEESALWQQFMLKRDIIPTPQGYVYEIPVVVHIVHNGEAVGSFYNPDDQQVQAFIDNCNEVYAAQSALFADTLNGGVYIPIRLVLAKRDPDCNPTNGIVRVNGSVLNGYATDGVWNDGSGNGISDATLKAFSRWPSRSYYNIWLVNKINNGGVSGFATQPTSGPELDGAVLMAYVAQPTSFHYGVFPHEMGHAFGLLHTFQGSVGSTCPPNANCAVDGDAICDTEPTVMVLNSCPTGVNTCTGANYNGVELNFMSYTDCRDRFTPDQKSKVLFSLLNYRYNLLTSLGLTPPGSDTPLPSPVAACVPAAIANAGNNFNVGPRRIALADMTITSQGYSNDSDRFYWDHTLYQCTQRQPVAHLRRDSTYTLSVSTGANAEYLSGWIDFNNDGTFSPAEQIISHNGSTGWETHTAAFSVPSTALTCTPLRMRIVSDMTFTAPQPCGNLQYGQAEDCMVMIDMLTPGLHISVSPGNTVSNGTTVTFSATATNGGSNPQYEWRRNDQPIAGINTATWTAVAGTDFVSGDMITARLRSDAGCVYPDTALSNALTLLIAVTGLEESENNAAFSLYPNPNSGTFMLSSPSAGKGNYELSVTDLGGRKVYTQLLPSGTELLQTEVQLGPAAPGMYVLMLQKEGTVLKRMKFTVLR